MVHLLGPARGARDASPQVPCEHQARDHREDVGGGTEVGWGQDLQEEVQDADEPETRRHGGWERQTTCRTVLPAEDGALPHGRVSALDNIPADGPLLVVPTPQADGEHLLKGCPKWRKQQRTLWKEVWKETGKGRRWWKAHEIFADRRYSQAVLNFLASTEVRKTAPAADEDARSEASEWELRERAEREEERRAEAETLGRGMEREEHPLFLPNPPFMALAGEE